MVDPIVEEHGDGRFVNVEENRGFTPDTTHTPSPPPEPLIAARPPVPGVVPYASPQTLLGQREIFLRNKSQPMLAATPIPEYPEHHSGPSSEAGSLYNYRSSSMPMPGLYRSSNVVYCL